jgi:type III secretory pathway component EscR
LLFKKNFEKAKLEQINKHSFHLSKIDSICKTINSQIDEFKDKIEKNEEISKISYFTQLREKLDYFENELFEKDQFIIHLQKKVT